MPFAAHSISMNKTIYIIAAVLVLVIVAGAGILLLNNGSNNQPTTTPPAATVNIPAATSLSFSVNDTSQNVTTTYKFYAANLNTENIALRVEVPGCDTGLNYTYVLKADSRTAYNSINNSPWTTENFTTAWPLWGNMLTGYVQKLDSWNSIAPYSYTASNGDPIVIYDITVNPSLPASTFQTS